MLMPKKVKYRKQQRGRMTGKAWRGSDISFGEYGLKAMECGWVTARQIEAARIAIRCADEDRDGGPRLDIETSNCRWNACQAEVAFDRTVDAQHLFDEIRDAIMLLT